MKTVCVVCRLIDAGTPRLALHMQAARRAYPDAAITLGSRCSPGWPIGVGAGPGCSSGTDTVVVAPGPDGEVGAAGVVEIVDALVAKVPVQVLRASGRLASLSCPNSSR